MGDEAEAESEPRNSGYGVDSVSHIEVVLVKQGEEGETVGDLIQSTAGNLRV